MMEQEQAVIKDSAEDDELAYIIEGWLDRGYSLFDVARMTGDSLETLLAVLVRRRQAEEVLELPPPRQPVNV